MQYSHCIAMDLHKHRFFLQVFGILDTRAGKLHPFSEGVPQQCAKISAHIAHMSMHVGDDRLIWGPFLKTRQGLLHDLGWLVMACLFDLDINLVIMNGYRQCRRPLKCKGPLVGAVKTLEP